MELNMFKILALYWAFFASTAYAEVDCNKNPIQCHILSIAPKTPNSLELSNMIGRAAKKYQVSARVLVAIAMAESTLRPIHRVVGVVDAVGCSIHVTDFGLFQINEHTIPIYQFDRARLLVDVEYQVDSGARVLADKMKAFKDWATYHSNTPRHRERYREVVSKWL